MNMPAQAFPTWNSSEVLPGMTLRNYFAAAAMQAIVSREDLDMLPKEKVVALAFSLADAMLTASEVQP